MACPRWTDSAISHLYGETDPAERREFERHLEGCPDCRAEFEALQEARDLLREGAPEIPTAPRVVLLGSRPARRPAASFAWGFASAAALLVLGIGIGWWIASAPGVTVPDGFRADRSDRPALETVSREEFDGRIGELQEALLERTAPERLPAPDARTADFVTREQLLQELVRVQRLTDEKRADDLSYLLTEIAASEYRVGTRVGETQQALRYAMLAGDPRLREQ
jgi:hypothetical protein